jgi:hypothetical protein
LVAFSGQPDNSYVFKLVFFLLCLPVHTNLIMALYRMTADTSHSLQLQGFANGDLTFQPIKFTGKCVYFFFVVANSTLQVTH